MRQNPLPIAALLVLAPLAAGVVLAAGPPRREPSADVPAEKFYKNIQVFQGLPSDQLVASMQFMADSLGVKCSYCHVTSKDGPWPMEKDDKAAKNTARGMIRMMREIDRANFKGRLDVTCATCHRGSVDPASMPPLFSTVAAHPPASEAAAAPSVDAVLERYVSAAGGKDAMAKISSRVIRGTFTAANGESHPIEITLTASGKYRSSVTLEKGAFTIAYDGTKGWSSAGQGIRPMPPDEADRIRARARLFPASDLKSRFPALAVRGKEPIDGRDAWIVMARDAAGGRETFWFDAENGRLLRTLHRQHTALGDIPEQADYSDYRKVDGVEVPFTIRHTAPDRTDTIKAEEVTQNVAVDDGLFSAREP